jgi:hypothetical protein
VSEYAGFELEVPGEHKSVEQPTFGLASSFSLLLQFPTRTISRDANDQNKPPILNLNENTDGHLKFCDFLPLSSFDELERLTPWRVRVRAAIVRRAMADRLPRQTNLLLFLANAAVIAQQFGYAWETPPLARRSMSQKWCNNSV